MRSRYLTTLPALIGAILIIGVYGCKKEEPKTQRASYEEESNTQTQKISYRDFPSHLQAILDKRIAELYTSGGICIAGRVKFNDGSPVGSGNDVMINLHHDIDEPLAVYEGGWFVMYRTVSSRYAGPDKGFVLRAFGYDPIDASFDVLANEITYVDFEMKRTPPDKLASVKGVVTDANDRPLEGADVLISFPFSYRGTPDGARPQMKTLTDPNGEYSFEGLSGAEYSALFAKSGYAYDSHKFTPPEGATVVKDVKLYPRDRVIIDYVYQADGSPNFTLGDLKTGTIDWSADKGGVDFSEGKVKASGPGIDLRLYQEKGVLKFRAANTGGLNGFSDAGVVPFDWVTVADETGYTGDDKVCKLYHVYVVRTSEEGNYAKFIVSHEEGPETRGETKMETQKPAHKVQPKTLNISYADFPPYLQTILDLRTLDMQAHGGACIAGKARFSDGAPVSSGKDIVINLYYLGDIPLQIYEGGWFVTYRTLNSYHAGPDRLFVLRAFGYDPIDASITILDKQVTYVGFEMKKTPPDKLSSVKGVVKDEHDRPLEGAYVNISFPFAYSWARPEMTIHTDAGGEYFFEGLSGGEHELYSSKKGYASDWDKFTPSEGATPVKDLKLYPRHRIVIDYVYQADGSRNFTSGDLKTGTINWGLYEGSLDLSDGKIERSGPGEDIRLLQEKGVLYFHIFYAGGPNGFYDAGAVPLDSVTEAADKGYTTQGNRPCKVGHVYVVRTREEDNYAKFIIKNLEAF
jgi:hypothetical protein